MAKAATKQKPSRVARTEAGGKSRDGFSLPPHRVYIVGVDTQHGQEHPLFKPDIVELSRREEYDDLTLRSIDSEGVFQPVRVVLVRVATDDRRWPDECRGKSVHVCLAGRHRIYHARKVVQDRYESGRIRELTDWQVDCILETRTDLRTLTRISRDENLLKRKVSPIELGVNVIQEIATGLTMEALSESTEYSVPQLKRFMAIASQGCPELHDAVRAGMSITAASRIAMLDDDEQRDVLAGTTPDDSDHEIMQKLDIAKGKPARIKPPTPKRWKMAAQRIAAQFEADNEPVWSDRELELFRIVTGQIALDDAGEELRQLFDEDEAA
jgi:hypothetical protein